MKQKYTITVADMDLNIISDASPDEVENIVGILDRRMRDINLKSPRCTKNEAAMLCALSYCSERIAMQEAFKKVEKDAFRFAGENEKLKRTIEELQAELDTLRKDAAVMRSILDQAAASNAQKEPAEAQFVAKTPAEKKAVIEEVEQLSALDNIPEQPTAPVPAAVPAQESEDAGAKKANKAKQSRVGNMFDLLTFSDI
ncbi:MAG: cell division protein ZapA [Clostridia bacterium]|nr:cell division protein ZapA [Clostridia bacterium]